MPPKKRKQPVRANPAARAQKRAKTTEDEEVELPAKPPSPTRPAAEEPKRKQRANVDDSTDVITDIITRTAERLKAGSTSTNYQLRLLISVSEGDILHGTKENRPLEKIQKQTKCLLHLTDKVEGAVDRELILTGDVRAIASAIMRVLVHIQVVIHKGIEESRFVEKVMNCTVLIPGSLLENEDVEERMRSLGEVDVSSIPLPFSNYHTVYIKGRIQNVMVVIYNLILIMNESKQLFYKDLVPDLFPIGSPVVGTFSDGFYKRSETAEKLLKQSRVSYQNYLASIQSQTGPMATLSNHSSHNGTTDRVDPKLKSKEQIINAVKQCNANSKSLQAMKLSIDIPLDYIKQLLDKIQEIRAKSNSNVVLEDTVKHGEYKSVIITGLADGNLTALRYLSALVQ